MSQGRLFGVGVGPGDPELITLRAARVISQAQVVAYPVARHGASLARAAAAAHLREGQREIELRYPVTTERCEHPGGYQAALAEFYDRAAEELAGHLLAGRDVAVLCEGDPFLYGSYMYLHERLAGRFDTEVVAGVTSFSAAAAAAGRPLVRREEVLSIIPGTLAPAALEEALRGAQAAAVLKLGRSFERVRAAARRAGVAAEAIYVERASTPRQRIEALEQVEGDVPYMSLVLVPGGGREARADGGRPEGSRQLPQVAAALDGRARGPAAGGTIRATAGTTRAAAGRTPAAGGGRLAVVGLGPAGPDWLTPEAARELREAQVLIGYRTYLQRVPPMPGQSRIASDNRVEAQRARQALELAAAGARVAVVSSGDPGIFAMAAAVLEEYERADGRLRGLELRVVAGVSAMQAAAARVGAPLGHDFCAISLSDNLKPWAVIERRLRAACAADLVLALYNPASRARREPLRRALALLRERRAPSTPVVLARDVGGEGEAVALRTLAELDPEAVDMRTLLIVGSSTTRSIPGPRPLAYTPRRYPPG